MWLDEFQKSTAIAYYSLATCVLRVKVPNLLLGLVIYALAFVEFAKAGSKLKLFLQQKTFFAINLITDPNID